MHIVHGDLHVLLQASDSAQRAPNLKSSSPASNKEPTANPEQRKPLTASPADTAWVSKALATQAEYQRSQQQSTQSPKQSNTHFPCNVSNVSENSSIAANLPAAASSPAKAQSATKAAPTSSMSSKPSGCAAFSLPRIERTALEELNAKDDAEKLAQSTSMSTQDSAGGVPVAAAADDDYVMSDAFGD